MPNVLAEGGFSLEGSPSLMWSFKDRKSVIYHGCVYAQDCYRNTIIVGVKRYFNGRVDYYLGTYFTMDHEMGSNGERILLKRHAKETVKRKNRVFFNNLEKTLVNLLK